MPRRRTNFRSKTQYLTQPRDSQGRWSRIGGVFTKVGSAIAKANGVDLGFALNPYKASATASGEYTKSIGGGFSSTTTVTTRVHRTDNKSPVKRLYQQTADKGLSRIGNRKAQGLARAVTGVQPRKVAAPGSSAFRIGKGGSIRSKSRRALAAEQARAQKKIQKRLRKRAAVERARAAGSTGQPNTITKGKPRPARRFATSGNVGGNSKSTASYKHLVVPYKAKRRRN